MRATGLALAAVQYHAAAQETYRYVQPDSCVVPQQAMRSHSCDGRYGVMAAEHGAGPLASAEPAELHVCAVLGTAAEEI